jgi:hypothetical protein
MREKPLKSNFTLPSTEAEDEVEAEIGAESKEEHRIHFRQTETSWKSCKA